MNYFKTTQGDFLNLEKLEKVKISYQIIDILDTELAPFENFKIKFSIFYKLSNTDILDTFIYESDIKTLRKTNQVKELFGKKAYKTTSKEQAEQIKLAEKIAEHGKELIILLLQDIFEIRVTSKSINIDYIIKQLQNIENELKDKF